MAKELEKNNIYVDKQSDDAVSDAIVNDFTLFIGRKKLLNEIKETVNTHFLFYGEPKIGKTSLLYILRDVLSESAKCCYIDMLHLIIDFHSYEDFEKSFFEKCLRQHFMDVSDLSSQEGYHAFRSMVNKIKGDKEFCVFCLDNFFIPHHFDEENFNNFITKFLRSMMIHPNVRFMMSCKKNEKNKIVKLFDEFRDIFSQRKLLLRPIPLFSVMEVKNALRKIISLEETVVEKVYNYIGRFPHLVHLYDKWNPGQQSLVEYSKDIARKYSEKIIEYFRDLSSNAYLFIATCLKYNLLTGKNNYTTFYENLPFLKNSLPRSQIEDALKEINEYGEGFSTEYDKDSFYMSMNSRAELLIEASKHISWLNHFSPLYQFTASSNLELANSVAQMFTQITQSELDLCSSLDEFMHKYSEIFYVNKLTAEGRRVLDIPLSTFIVIPLHPWEENSYKKAFNDLHVSLQEFKRSHSESTPGGTLQKFYVLLFEMHGTPGRKVKEDLIGLERISIIDASMMKDIILDKSPREKASDYIFDQLSIKERSPYTTSGAVPDELFYGREMEIQLIRGLPENIGIFGTRTIGKTSLLRRLNKDIKSQTRWKVYTMDCSRIDNEEILLKNLAEKMEIPFGEISDIDKFRKYITREAEKSGQQYLFLLDEIDRLVQYDIGHEERIFNTFNRLCSETMKNDESPVRFILCGFHQMFEQMKNPASRLYNFMVFLPLKPLDVKSALALVTQPIEKIRVKWKDREDALYLVNSCSCHPRLLQAACHSLLAILDSKKGKKDIIERADVDQALTSAIFREMCMRFYHNPEGEKEENFEINKEKKIYRKKSIRYLFKDLFNYKIISEPEQSQKGKNFVNDLHRITILTAIRLRFEKKKESFTIADIYGELKRYIPDISPNVMRVILDHLCLSGIFNLKNESTLIARKDAIVQDKVIKKGIMSKEKKLAIDKPEVYRRDDAIFPKFVYEFGVNIFPTLLVAHFGGIDQCEEELKKLIKKKDWEEWIRRY